MAKYSLVLLKKGSTMHHLKSRLLLGSALLLFCALLSAGASFPVAWAAQAKASGAQTAATTCPPTIGYGNVGTAVKEAQGSLNNRYEVHNFPNSPYNFSPPLKVDGIFGRDTEYATMDFQTAYHLSVDGIIGPQTWHALHWC